MGRATAEQKIELYRRFFPLASLPEAQMFVESSRQTETMAEFQGLLLAIENRKDKHDRGSLESEFDQCEAIVR
jgi:hypothetical protein